MAEEARGSRLGWLHERVRSAGQAASVWCRLEQASRGRLAEMFHTLLTGHIGATAPLRARNMTKSGMFYIH